MQHDEISARVKKELREYRAGLDPVALLRSIREAQSAIAAMSSPQLQETPHSESIDRFLARLPSLWQQGEARPTRKARVRLPRHWRSKDPFEGEDLQARLRSAHPGRFSDAQLRIQQPGVKDWRGVMAKRLVYAASDERAVGQRHRGDSALAGGGISGRYFGNILW